ncbi:hypothetical protein GCK32_022358 [Trichostrongylus colubriformis]|uniref:Uncharacterized protein n=1 Tax=Trichostrongylus colubriformis TaxID=6319 RepID=A0AAN8FSH9_TRICO
MRTSGDAIRISVVVHTGGERATEAQATQAGTAWYGGEASGVPVTPYYGGYTLCRQMPYMRHDPRTDLPPGIL